MGHDRRRNPQSQASQLSPALAQGPAAVRSVARVRCHRSSRRRAQGCTVPLSRSRGRQPSPARNRGMDWREADRENARRRGADRRWRTLSPRGGSCDGPDCQCNSGPHETRRQSLPAYPLHARLRAALAVRPSRRFRKGQPRPGCGAATRRPQPGIPVRRHRPRNPTGADLRAGAAIAVESARDRSRACADHCGGQQGVPGKSPADRRSRAICSVTSSCTKRTSIAGGISSRRTGWSTTSS